MIPSFGPPPGHHPYRQRHGAYALLIREDSVLLTFQLAPDCEFQLPGGGIDPGESPIAALHREVREETGWTIGTPRRLGAYRRYCFMPDYDIWAEKMCSVWIARPISRLGPPSERGHEAHWVDRDQVVNLLTDPGARAFASAVLKRR